MLAPTFALYFNHHWPWAMRFPVAWLGILLNIMITFFHELGHTVVGWFYGYVALPSFDLVHGGGMTYYVTRQLWPLSLFVDGGLLYVVWQLREHRPLCMLCVGVLLWHLATAYNGWHNAMLSMAGPLAEIGVAGFMLWRAWFNRAPRGIGERLANAVFGFGFGLYAILFAWALLHDADVRQVYLEQKGSHGFGDFDQAATILHMPFQIIVGLYLVMAVLAIILPVGLYIWRDRFWWMAGEAD